MNREFVGGAASAQDHDFKVDHFDNDAVRKFWMGYKLALFLQYHLPLQPENLIMWKMQEFLASPRQHVEAIKSRGGGKNIFRRVLASGDKLF